MVLLAFAGGSWLGSFVVFGLSHGERPVASASEAADYWQERDRAREARTAVAAAPVAHFVGGVPESHQCEGCDAHLVRDRQLGASLDAQYPPPLGEAGAAPDASPDASSAAPPSSANP